MAAFRFISLWFVQALVLLGKPVLCHLEERTLAESTNEPYLRAQRRPPNPTNSMTSTIVCRLTIVDTLIDDGSRSMEHTACVPIRNGTETDDIYEIDLPQLDHTNLALVQRGDLLLQLVDVTIEAGRILINGSSKVRRISPDDVYGKGSRRLMKESIGRQTVTVVRISTRDSSPIYSAVEIKTRLFGDSVGLRSQYMACSFGRLVFEPAEEGVVEVFVDADIASYENGSALVQAAQSVLRMTRQLSSVAELADRVLFIVPKGTGGWVASAPLNHWRSQYNDEWGLSLTATMHELGHSMGLLHANENGRPYADSTGYMAAGHKSQDWPRKCFNGYHLWKLGWYRTRSLSLFPTEDDEPQRIVLSAFVDFDRANTSEPVLISLLDRYFLAFNVAKSFNQDTGGKRNKVTITEPGVGGTESLAGLGEGDAFALRTDDNKQLFVQACEVLPQSQYSPERVLIAVAVGESQPCLPSPSRAPTSRPSSSPTLQPTTTTPSAYPSPSPSILPSAAPTGRPSSAPSEQPSTEPTETPTQHPTQAPTIFLVPSGYPSTTASPSVQKTPPPSLSPTIVLRTDEPTLPKDVSTRTLVPTHLPTHLRVPAGNVFLRSENHYPEQQTLPPSPWYMGGTKPTDRTDREDAFTFLLSSLET